jgi:ATP-dependent DNA helicase RecG
VPAKIKFNPRIMMEKAVAVMRHSVNEPRTDKKASPLVGAVLYKPGGSIETAYRGELRHGDHAEYTLLERKHRNERLDGSVLFATLEPCAPGARKHPKLSCAERIVLARIKEVWIGIEDPDPTVDRQGIKYLQDNGVAVHLFDRDMQDEIQKANKTFIDQARGRAAEAKQTKTTKLSALSMLENAQAGLTLDDLSEKALAHYRKRAQMPETVGSRGFNRRLILQGFLRQVGRKLVPTGHGLLLFGQVPRDVIPQAGLKGTIEYPNGDHEIRDFDGPLIMIPAAVESWLRDKLPNVIDRSRMTRGEKAAVPFDSVREAVINALVHRNYDITGATCHLLVTANTIIVKSPGTPPPPVTLNQMQAFNAPMLNRNPKLQFVFGGTKLVEGRGLGMRTLGSMAEKYHLPLPKFSFDGIYLTLTIYRNMNGAVQALSSKILKELNEDEKKGWQMLSTKNAVTRSSYAAQMVFDARKAQRHLSHFVELGLIKRVGSGPATAYEVVRK